MRGAAEASAGTSELARTSANARRLFIVGLSWFPTPRASSSGDLPAPPRPALAPGTARVILRFHQKRNAPAIRALLGSEELGLEPTARTIAAIASEAASTVHVLPRSAALRARGIVRECRTPHDLA